jgi:FkbM family methyltransferase
MAELVFDIGMNTGDDTAYYVHLGHRVVGVEANPLRVADCLKRFEKEVRDGRVIVVNAGILREKGEFPFFRHLTVDSNSTFCEPTGDPGNWERITVSCTTVAGLVKEYGKPYFIKSDIEGADFQVLEGLTPEISPKYISLEVNLRDPFVARLVKLGYSSFKLINGESRRASEPIFAHQWGWRAFRKIGRAVPTIRSLVRNLPSSIRPPKAEWDDEGIYNPDGYAYSDNCSGPFGELADGQWMDARRADAQLEWLRRHHRRAGLVNVWWDLHARRGAG